MITELLTRQMKANLDILARDLIKESGRYGCPPEKQNPNAANPVDGEVIDVDGYVMEPLKAIPDRVIY